MTLNHLSAFMSGNSVPVVNLHSNLFTVARQTSARLGLIWDFSLEKTISLTRRGDHNKRP